jgi:hypothetical protein
MARKISEIKDGIASEFMQSEAAASAYGFVPGASFTSTFSRVSIESILFDVFAFGAWLLENLFDSHRAEVEARIEAILAHRPRWYAEKARAFMLNHALLPDTDRYDTTGMTEDQIVAARVVRHAVATEDGNTSILTIKVAGEADGERGPLTDATAVQLAAYLSEVKDAGVHIELVNLAPDTFNCRVDVWYNPQLSPGDVQQACLAAIVEYIQNLPFNGEYTNMSLVDAVQSVDGVRIVEFRSATTSNATTPATQSIDARHTPLAGYFMPGAIILNLKV